MMLLDFQLIISHIIHYNKIDCPKFYTQKFDESLFKKKFNFIVISLQFHVFNYAAPTYLIILYILSDIASIKI